jgi:heat shock protein HslJ
MKRVAWLVAATVAVSACGVVTSSKKTSEGLLSGTNWQLQQLGSQGAIAGNQPTLSFTQEGRVSGSGSCNQFSGPVAVSGKSIAFGTFASTRMACTEALNTQESAYFKALQEAEWFNVLDGALSIYTKSMEQPLVFLRSPP